MSQTPGPLDVTLVPQAGAIPHATPGIVTSPFWDACRSGVLTFQRCENCRQANFLPTEHCRECGGRSLTWEASTGIGRLYSWTVVSRPVTPDFNTPYAAAIVTLDEGYQMVTNIIRTTGRELKVDLPVRVAFVPVTDALTLPYFEPM